VLDFTTVIDDATGEPVVELPLTGVALLDNPVFNKGSAFPYDERSEFGLHGLLPPHVGSLDEQLARRYDDFRQRPTALLQHVYLRELQDRNETLF
jgi:malate dehydrogenase (oxaloacetate-decarboxylating)